VGLNTFVDSVRQHWRGDINKSIVLEQREKKFKVRRREGIFYGLQNERKAIDCKNLQNILSE